jgi:hypothetical protein
MTRPTPLELILGDPDGGGKIAIGVPSVWE